MPIIQSVDRALQILDLFDEYNTELKITEISLRLNLHKSTTHSLLKTLQHHNYIKQNLQNGKYGLGLKLFERGSFVINSLDIREISKRYLIELSVQTGQTVNLVILDGKEGLYIDKIEGPSTTVLYSRVGGRVPIHTSAVGKVLVGFKTGDEIEKILAGYVFKKQTNYTILYRAEFLSELEHVRRQGYAVDNQENEPGICCIAVPIRDHTKRVVAAISLSATVTKIKDDKDFFEKVVQKLKRGSDEISNQLGYESIS
jgi:IclR family KDG regulon transcriptional repressor